MFILPFGQFVMVIKSFQHFSELTTEDEENWKPGRRRWVASSIPTQIYIYIAIAILQWHACTITIY